MSKNLTGLNITYLTNLASPSLTLPVTTLKASKNMYFLHFIMFMPDDLFKKSPKFGKIIFGDLIMSGTSLTKILYNGLI